jgi:GT2 family glycosyltransferase
LCLVDCRSVVVAAAAALLAACMLLASYPKPYYYYHYHYHRPSQIYRRTSFIFKSDGLFDYCVAEFRNMGVPKVSVGAQS